MGPGGDGLIGPPIDRGPPHAAATKSTISQRIFIERP